MRVEALAKVIPGDEGIISEETNKQKRKKNDGKEAEKTKECFNDEKKQDEGGLQWIILLKKREAR